MPLEVPSEGTVKYVIGVWSTNSKQGFEEDFSDYYIETRAFNGNAVKESSYTEKYDIKNQG